MALLEVSDLHKAFGGIRAVNGAAFSVAQGSVTSLIGPNGAGKTTAFNMINGVLPADRGSARLDGVELIGKRPHQVTKLGISRTFQVTRPLPALTVVENMALAAPAGGVRALLGSKVLEREREQALGLLEFVGIARLADSKAADLSYGQRKLLEFAAVMMSNPRLVLLDEPAGGVNPALLEEITSRIDTLRHEGITFRIVEHNMDLVMQLSDSVIVMAQGQVIVQDRPEVVQTDPRVLDAYLGVA